MLQGAALALCKVYVGMSFYPPLDVHSDDVNPSVYGIPHNVHHLNKVILSHDEHIAGVQPITIEHFIERRIEPRKLASYDGFHHVHVCKAEASTIMLVNVSPQLVRCCRYASVTFNQISNVRYVVKEEKILPIATETDYFGQRVAMVGKMLVSHQFGVKQPIQAVCSLVIGENLP